jgi:hypothetical protein
VAGFESLAATRYNQVVDEDQPSVAIAKRIAAVLKDENSEWLVTDWEQLPPGWGYGLIVQMPPGSRFRNHRFDFYLRLCDNGVLSITRTRVFPKSMDRFAVDLVEPGSLVQLALILLGSPNGVTLDPSKL